MTWSLGLLNVRRLLTMAEVDWNAEAVRAAEHVHEHLFGAHRGAIPWETLGVSAASGNDGDSLDDRAKAEVGLLRESLRRAGNPELSFGVGGEGYTWAMIVETAEHEDLYALVWDAWDRARSGSGGLVVGGVQPEIAAESCDEASRQVLRPSVN
jgi:hypothetical protein